MSRSSAAARLFEKTIVPEAYGPNQMGSAGWVPKQPSVTVTDLEPGMPAEKAGMQAGRRNRCRGRTTDSPASKP